MITKHKKAFMYEFLVRLVIALLFLFGAIYIVKSLFRISSTAEESFNKFVTLIDSDIPEGQTTTMALTMDQKTAIAIFNEKVSNLKFTVRKFEAYGETSSVVDYTYSMKKPEGCQGVSSDCACLCKKTDTEKTEVTCLKSVCKPITPKTLPLYKQCAQDFDCIDSSTGGSIFLRDIEGVQLPRAKTIYATNYNGFVAICEKVPCPSDEIKKERTVVGIMEAINTKYVYFKNDLIKVSTTNTYLDIYYYITDLKKDAFNIYYYEYKSAIGGSFRTESSEQAKDFFEENRFENLQKGKKVTVKRPSQKPESDIENFKPNYELQQDGTLKKLS